MDNVISLAEFQYRKAKQQDDRCKRIAKAMLEEHEPPSFTAFLEKWVENNKDNGPDAA